MAPNEKGRPQRRGCLGESRGVEDARSLPNSVRPQIIWRNAQWRSSSASVRCAPLRVRRSQSVSRKSKSPYPRLQLWDGGEGQLGAFQQMAALSNNLCFHFFSAGGSRPQQTHSRPTILRGELCSTGRCARTFGFPTPRLDLSRQHAGPGRGEQWRQHFFGSSFVRRANLLQHAVSPRS